MVANKTDHAAAVRYQADESPPIALSFGLGLQLAILCIAGIVLTPAIVIRAAGGTEAYLSWALFAAVGVSGVTTIVQAVRLGRVGAGYVLLMGTSGAFIAICVTAIAEGGPAMLATLVVISSLFQFTISRRLSLLRRILTPTVAGTVIMLIAVTVMPIVFDMLTQVPGEAAALGTRDLRIAALFGLYDTGPRSSAQRPCDNHPHRRHRAQADGVGNLLSGLAGTVPNTTYSSSVSITELTGVAARSVGVAVGVVFVAMAFLPKALAVILAIPGPVAAAYITVLIAILFVVGMRIVIQDGVDHRNGLIAGVSFWIGVGLQNGVIFPEYFSEFAGGLLQNGMTGGGLVAVLLTLMNQDRSGDERSRRRLLVVAHKQAGEAVLDFIAAPGTANLEDRIALLGEQTATASLEREVSLRLLRHLASSVRHQQYHDTDIVTIHVTPPDAVRSA